MGLSESLDLSPFQMNSEDHLRWLHPFSQTGRGGAEELRQPASMHKAIVTIPNTHSPEPSQENAWPGLDIQREPRVSPKWASALSAESEEQQIHYKSMYQATSHLLELALPGT